MMSMFPVQRIEIFTSNMLISNQENPAKFSNMETNNGVNLKNWGIYTYQVLQFPMDSKI